MTFDDADTVIQADHGHKTQENPRSACGLWNCPYEWASQKKMK